MLMAFCNHSSTSLDLNARSALSTWHSRVCSSRMVSISRTLRLRPFPAASESSLPSCVSCLSSVWPFLWPRLSSILDCKLPLAWDRRKVEVREIESRTELMKKSRFTESQIVAILKEADAGMKVADVCRRHGISQPTYYNWKSRYGGLGVRNSSGCMRIWRWKIMRRRS